MSNNAAGINAILFMRMDSLYHSCATIEHSPKKVHGVVPVITPSTSPLSMYIPLTM